MPLSGRVRSRPSPDPDRHRPGPMAHLAEEVHTPSQRVTVMLAVHPW